MKFHLVDKIIRIEPGKRIVTIKALSLAEEYLADHFPTFPVMPGVLMLEAMVQSAAWLTRIQQDFAKSIVMLSCAKNVRYASFVAPGNVLQCDVEAVEIGPDSAKFKASATVEDRQAVSARLELKCFNLRDRHAYLAQSDEDIVRQLRQRFKLVGGPEALAAAQSAPAA
jgi:3-hydroxyacyl-[acyl-carrier-protein] dehydratase